MIRSLRGALPDLRYHVHYVKVTGLSKRDMCREIAKAIGVADATPDWCAWSRRPSSRALSPAVSARS